MTLTIIHTAPSLAEDFTTLEEHQSQTPSSFFNAKPVLHFHSQLPLKAIVPRGQQASLTIFQSSSDTSTASNEDPDSLVSIGLLDVFVSSQNLIIFSPALSSGLIIPYPSISLHAISSFPGTLSIPSAPKTLYMQLDLSDPSMSEEDEPETIELTLIPTSPPPSSTPEEEINALFTAISTCSNLNPDPVSQDVEMNEDGTAQGDSRIRFEGNVGYEGISGLPGVSRGVDNGGLPPPFPGSGGWITAENVGEFFDGEGNWIGGGEDGEEGAEGDGVVVLGEGAGRVRARDEMEADEEHAVGTNGVSGDADDDSKWRRTS